MNKFVTIALLAAALIADSAARAELVGNPKAGRDKAATCMGCHDIADYRTAYPKVYRAPLLGGQNEKYLITALNEYKQGARKFQTMRANAASLSDQDIADIASYYAAQTSANKSHPSQ